MKKIILLILTIIISLSCFKVVVNAYEDVDYTKEDVTSLVNFSGYNANQDSKTKDVSITANGAFVFGNDYQNVEFVGNYKFDSIGSIQFVMRSENTIANQTYSRSTGYRFIWYSHGAGELFRQNELLVSYPGGTIPAINTNDIFNIKLKVVDTIEGYVHITIVINEISYVDYVDKEPSENITGGCIGIFNESNLNYTISGLEKYAELEVNDMAKFSGYNSVLDNKTNNVKVNANGCFLFNDNFNNISVSQNIKFDNVGGHVQFVMRSENTIANQTYSRSAGYHFFWYNHGALELYKQTTLLSSLPGWSIPMINTTDNYNVNIKTINTLAGHVYISFSINDVMYLSYIDRMEDEPLYIGTSYGMFNEGNMDYSVIGNGLNYPIISPFTTSRYQNGNSNYNKAEYDGSVTLNYNNAHANSGITFPIETTDSYGFVTNITPINPGGYAPADLRFTIGQRKTKDVWSIPDFYYEGVGGWSTCGYIVHWTNGSVYVTRGSNDLNLVPDASSAIAQATCSPIIFGNKYKVELAITPFGDGSTMVIFKVDDVIYLNFFDRQSEGYEPVTMPKQYDDVSVEDVLTYASIFSSPQVVVNVSAVSEEELNNANFEEKTVIINDLGEYDKNNSNVNFDLNGVPNNFKSGTFNYTGENSNSLVTFNVNFTKIGNYLELSFKEGYKIKIINNGNIEVYKNDRLILITTSNLLLNEVKKTYKISFGNRNLSNSKMSQVLLTIDDVTIVNYLDSINPIKTTNSFTFTSDGYEGNIAPNIEIPNIVIVDGLGATNTGFIGRPITLGIDKETTDVEYFVSSENSTINKYKLENNILIVEDVGTICVYAKVNELYTDYYYIEIAEPVLNFTNLPTDVVIAGDTLNIEFLISDNREIVSSQIEIISGSLLCTIKNNTVTFKGAGTIQIKIIAEDIYGNKWETSLDEGFINVVPKISLGSKTEILKGEEIKLEVSYNCAVSQDDTLTFEIVNGSTIITLTNDLVKGRNIGEAKIRVIFAKGKPYETSEEFVLSVYGIILDIPNSPIIIGGQKIKIGAHFSNQKPVNNISYYSTDGTGGVTIDKNTGVISGVTAGTANIYTIIDGVKSDEYQIVVLPQIEIKNTNTLCLGGSRYLDFYINSKIPNEDIEYIYEILTGYENVEIDSETGYITAKKLGYFTVRLTMIADSFVVYSPQVTIAIENPITVVTIPPKDMYVGEKQTINYSFGNGEVPVNEVKIEIKEGNDLVVVDGLTITALKQGSIKFTVVANDVEGISYRLYITELEAQIAVSDMYINDKQNVYVFFNDDNIDTSKIVLTTSDLSIASFNGNILIPTGKDGKVDIIATLNQKEVARKTINIKSIFEISNLPSEIYHVDEFIIDINVLNTLDDNYKLEVTPLTKNITINVLPISSDVYKRQIQIIANNFGEASFKIKIAEKYSKIVNFTIKEKLNDVIGIVVNDMFTSSTQDLKIITDGNGNDPIVTYKVIDGSNLVSLDVNKLTSLGKLGEVEIGAYIADNLIISKKINIKSRVKIIGLTNNQDITIGEEYAISYSTDLDNISKVEYIIVSGDATFNDNTLIANAIGEIVIKVVVDTNESETLTINVIEAIAPEEPDNVNLPLIISLSVIGGVAVLSIIGILIFYLNRKKRGKNNE